MLDAIIASVREELPAVIAAEQLLLDKCVALGPPRDLRAALAVPGLGVIAEVKRRSPSAGEIAPDLVPPDLATSYESGGAAAISVLTERAHFGGSLQDLEEVAGAVGVPVLRKDFMFHPAQVAEARANGADAVLVIVAALSDAEIDALLARCRELSVTALVEVHDESELRRAVAAGAEVVGVNNRDLHTLRVDLRTAERLRSLLPADSVTVAESGVKTAEDAKRMSAAGYDAVLVGGAAAAAADPEVFVASLRGYR